MENQLSVDLIEYFSNSSYLAEKLRVCYATIGNHLEKSLKISRRNFTKIAKSNSTITVRFG